MGNIKFYTNEQIIAALKKIEGISSTAQLTEHINNKYGLSLNRTSIGQWSKRKSAINLPGALLHEFFSLYMDETNNDFPARINAEKELISKLMACWDGSLEHADILIKLLSDSGGHR